jgi:hypothetical protein
MGDWRYRSIYSWPRYWMCGDWSALRPFPLYHSRKSPLNTLDRRRIESQRRSGHCGIEKKLWFLRESNSCLPVSNTSLYRVHLSVTAVGYFRLYSVTPHIKDLNVIISHQLDLWDKLFILQTASHILDILQRWIAVRKTTPCSKPCRPIGLWDAKDPTLSRQSAHRWRWGCQPYAPAALYSPETLFCFWYSFLLEAGRIKYIEKIHSPHRVVIPRPSGL